MALNGVYRFLYFYLMKKIPIKDVPSGLEEYVFDLEGVELGKYALQLPPPSDNKVSPDDSDDSKKNAMQMQVGDGAEKTSKAYYSVDLSAIELQPLLQRMENIENQMMQLRSNNPSKIVEPVETPQMDSGENEQQPLIQRMSSIENQNSEMSRKFESMDSRFDGMDSRFIGVDSRFDMIEAKLNGILVALIKPNELPK
jgi:hypothetical protein